MKYYKVVREEDGILQSCIVTGHAKVIYKVGEWSIAPNDFALYGYHILVFNNLIAAKKFASEVESNCTISVYEIEVSGKIKLPKSGYFHPANVGYQFIPELIATKLFYFWPRYTRMFERVKLTNKVWSFNEILQSS